MGLLSALRSRRLVRRARRALAVEYDWERREHDRLRWRGVFVGYVLLMAVVGYGFWLDDRDDARLERNDARLERNDRRVQELREARVQDFSRADRVICERLDTVYTSIRGVLEQSAALRRRDGTLNAERRELLAQALRDFAPLDCGDLPSQREFRR